MLLSTMKRFRLTLCVLHANHTQKIDVASRHPLDIPITCLLPCMVGEDKETSLGHKNGLLGPKK